MASSNDIELVRRQTNELDNDNYVNSELSAYIDELGVVGASIRIWEQKAARYSDLVDTTEGGASHKYSDLHKNAMAMASHYRSIEELSGTATGGRPVVKRIVRQ